MDRYIEFKPDDPQSVEAAQEQKRIMEKQGFFEAMQIQMGVWILIVMKQPAPLDLTAKGWTAAQTIDNARL